MRWRDAFRAYDSSCASVPKVANILAKMVNGMVNAGTDPDKITLVGFSLGAHIVGIAGQKTSKKIGRVVGWCNLTFDNQNLVDDHNQR